MVLKSEIFDLQVKFSGVKKEIEEKIMELNKLNGRNGEKVLSQDASEEEANTYTKRK